MLPVHATGGSSLVLSVPLSTIVPTRETAGQPASPSSAICAAGHASRPLPERRTSAGSRKVTRPTVRGRAGSWTERSTVADFGLRAVAPLDGDTAPRRTGTVSVWAPAVA